MEKRKTARRENPDLKWLREYGFKRYPGRIWLKVAVAGCSAVMRQQDNLGWNCIIDCEIDLPDSKATFVSVRSSGDALIPKDALAAAIRGFYDLQDTLADVDLDGALINLSNPREK